MEEELLLEEQDRVKLDGIVSQMESNGESTEDIQFVVSDFKQKYGKPSTPSSDIPDPVDTALPESEPLKKKEESQSSVYQSPSGNSDSVLVSDGEDEDFLHGLIKDRFPKFAAWRKENRRSFNAATNEALAGVSGIPNLLNQSLFSAFAPDELKEEIDSMEPESRETVINSFLSLGGPVGVNPGLLGMASDQAQEKLLEKANNIRANMEQFDTSINQDFAEGNYTQAMKRVGTEGIGSIPSVVQAMIPYVGIPSIIGGSAANKLEEEEEEGNIGDDVVLNSWVNGTAEGLLELVTKKIGGRVLKSMKATPKKSKTILESVVTGLGAAGEEGLSEAATTYIQNLSDEIIQGKDVDWDQAWNEIKDSFIIGAAVGGGLGGAQVSSDVANKMIENAQERNVQKFMTEEEKGKHIQNQKEVSEIVDMVNDPNTPESLKEDLNSIAEQKAKEGGDFEGSVMERMDDYNMDTALSIMALDKQIMDAKRTFQSVKDNPDISDGLREEVYGKLKNKLDELQKQKKN